MPLFTLPLGPYDIRPSSRIREYPRGSQKRKRTSSPDDITDFSSELQHPTSDAEHGSSSIAALSTNPLSLTPAEVAQYRLAGLDLDQELPSNNIKDWPHRGFPAAPPFPTSQRARRRRSGPEDETEDEENRDERGMRAPHLRMQHLSVLVTILHHRLLEGDIPRASRAWALLLRAQVGGRGIDVRSAGYWGIGAEVLIRGGERHMRRRRSENGSDEGDSGEGDDAESEVKKQVNGWEQRWGTAAGLEKAKEYYERLIVQHPYKRQYYGSINSLDFWLAMLGCEIYGIQFEQKEALRKLATAEENGEEVGEDDFEEEEFREDDSDAYMAAHERRETRKEELRREILWDRREEVRQTALTATQKIAARMDELMTSLPFSDSHALHRLRGMLAFYVGDLSVPALLSQEESEDGDNDSQSRRDTIGTEEQLAKRRLLERQRRAEHERGLVKRSEERVRARKAFEKILKDGGRVEIDMARLV